MRFQLGDAMPPIPVAVVSDEVDVKVGDGDGLVGQSQSGEQLPCPQQHSDGQVDMWTLKHLSRPPEEVLSEEDFLDSYFKKI